MFLNIENKEDSAEKLAAVAGKPTKNYLFAPEFNYLVNSVNTLRHLITLNAGNIDYILSAAVKLELGEIETSYINAINAMYEVELIPPVLITYTLDDIFYVKAFVGNSSVYGTNTGLFVTESIFLPIYESDSDEASQPSNQDNIPKKVTFTFAQLGLEPTATQEEIILAVKVANAGDIVADNELRYIEVVEATEALFNFDITANWNSLGVNDVDSFIAFLQDKELENIDVHNFDLNGNNLKCMLNCDGSIFNMDASQVTEVNQLGGIQGLDSIGFVFNPITKFTPILPNTISSIYLNVCQINDWSDASWISNLGNNGVADLSSNPVSASGSAVQTALLAKGWTVTI